MTNVQNAGLAIASVGALAVAGTMIFAGGLTSFGYFVLGTIALGSALILGDALVRYAKQAYAWIQEKRKEENVAQPNAPAKKEGKKAA
jgi:hypothetical protein